MRRFLITLIFLCALIRLELMYINFHPEYLKIIWATLGGIFFISLILALSKKISYQWIFAQLIVAGWLFFADYLRIIDILGMENPFTKIE